MPLKKSKTVKKTKREINKDNIIFSKVYSNKTKLYKRRKKKNVNILKNIEGYIYTNQFNHVYLYSDISNTSILNVKLQIDEFNRAEYLEQKQSSIKPKPIILHINSPGGDLIAGLSLLRIIEESKVPIIVLVEGISASAATFVTVAADYRLISPYASILIHQYSGGITGKHEDILFEAHVGQKIMKVFYDMYSTYTKMPKYKIKNILQHDLFLKPKECLEYGLVDKILKPTQPIIYRKYLTRNKEYNNIIKIINDKSLFNIIYLYGEYEPHEFYEHSIITVTQIQNILSSVSDNTIINNDLINNNNANNVKLINIGDPKPILLSISDNSFFDSLQDVLPIINTILLSRIPIYSFIDGPATESTIVYSILCYKRYIHKYAHIRINFASLWKEGQVPKYIDIIKNTKVFRQIILQLFTKYTKLPKFIIDNLFTRQHYFTPQDCVKYGICDEII